jgi:hypothetical protein
LAGPGGLAADGCLRCLAESTLESADHLRLYLGLHLGAHLGECLRGDRAAGAGDENLRGRPQDDRPIDLTLLDELYGFIAAGRSAYVQATGRGLGSDLGDLV